MGLPLESKGESNSSSSSTSESKGRTVSKIIGLQQPMLPRSLFLPPLCLVLSLLPALFQTYQYLVAPPRQMTWKISSANLINTSKLQPQWTKKSWVSYPGFFFWVLNLDPLVGRAPNCNLDLFCVPALQNAPNDHRQEGQCCLHLQLQLQHVPSILLVPSDSQKLNHTGSSQDITVYFGHQCILTPISAQSQHPD